MRNMRYTGSIIIAVKVQETHRMLLMGMKTSLMKKPMKPIIANPISAARPVSVSSAQHL